MLILGNILQRYYNLPDRILRNHNITTSARAFNMLAVSPTLSHICLEVLKRN